MVAKLVHHIYAGTEVEADELTNEFAGDGYRVTWGRHRPGGYIELIVTEPRR